MNGPLKIYSTQIIWKMRLLCESKCAFYGFTLQLQVNFAFWFLILTQKFWIKLIFPLKKNKHSRHFKLNSIYLHCQAVFQFIFRQCLFIFHLKGGKIVSFETKTFEMNQKPFWIHWLEIIESKYQAIYRMISYLS